MAALAVNAEPDPVGSVIAAVVHAEPENSGNRLADLGLDDDLLLEAAQVGFLAWSNATPHHPLSYPGFVAWGDTLKALADRLVPRGWEKIDETGMPLIVNADGTIAVTVWTCDDATGRPGRKPTTQSRKGPRATDFVESNAVQLELFSPDTSFVENPKPREESPGRVTWVLLIHMDTFAREIRCELSCPIGIGPDRHVDDWSERIILRSTPFDDTSFEIDSGGDGPNIPEVDVPIKRRA